MPQFVLVILHRQPLMQICGADTTRLARTISAHPPDGVHRIRSLLRGPGDAEFERALIEETANEVAAFATPEVRARLRAFADRARRSP